MSNSIKTNNGQSIIELQLSVLVFQEGDYFIAYCPSLELSSYGNSIQDAKDGFDDVMRSYIEECEQSGSLHEDLTKHGWTLNVLHDQQKAEPPAQVELNIPAGLLKTQFNENWKIPVC